MIKNISRPANFLLFCLLGLGLAIGQLFVVSAAAAQNVTIGNLSVASLQALQEEGETNCLQPPANLNLSTLSDAQLALYGFPTHAAIQQDLTHWETILANAKHRVCGSSPAPFDPGVNGAAQTQTTNVTASKRYNNRWGGQGAYGPKGTYREASADFSVPAAQPSSYSQNSTVSFWVGVGGDAGVAGKSSWEVVQTGISTQVAPNGTETSFAFWENEGVGGDTNPQNFDLKISTNDEIIASVTSNLGSDEENFYSIEDKNTKTYNSTHYYSEFSDSATGECVAEANAGYPADFVKESFDNCAISTNSTTQTVNNWNHYYYVPTPSGDGTTAPMMTSSSISSTGNFTVYWQS